MAVILTGLRVTLTQGAITTNSTARAAVALPSIEAQASAHADGHMVGAMRLPRLRAKGYSGGFAEITLPMLTFAGSMTIPNIGRADLALPMLTVVATGLTGYTAQGEMTLPRMTAVGYMGAQAAVRLPSIRSSATGRVDTNASAEIRLPALRVSAIGHRSLDAAEAYIVLPALRAGTNVRGAIRLPMLLVSVYSRNDAVADVVNAWSFNIRKSAMTQFSNFPFRAFLRFNNKYYGIGLQGNLYLLEGNLDNTAPIASAFETGLDDMESPAQKGIMGAYIDGQCERGTELTLVTDNNNRYTYSLTSPVNGHDYRIFRVQTGRGIRTHNLGVGISNDLGGYIEINRIAPDLVVSKRSV